MSSEEIIAVGAPRSCLQGRLESPGCLQGAGVNIMTAAVRVMDGDDTDTAPVVDTEFLLLVNGLY